MTFMMDFLRVLPYLLVAAAMFLLFIGGLIYTFQFFRNTRSRIGKTSI